jgi:hypothetical protein
MITAVPDPNTPIPISEGVHIGDSSTFDEYAEQMPETATGFLESVQSTPDAESDEGESIFESASGITSDAPPPTKTIKMSRKMKRAMDKLKDKAANLPIMWFHQQAKNNPEWELDDDEKELITDAIGTVFEVLDIEIEIQPLSWTLTSIYWVLGYPIVAFLFLFLTKKSMTMDREQQVSDAQ